MVAQSDSLAHHLWLANYKEAIDRLNIMIGEIGLKKENQTEVDWKDRNGIAGRYDETLQKFKQMVDYFVEYSLFIFFCNTLYDHKINFIITLHYITLHNSFNDCKPIITPE